MSTPYVRMHSCLAGWVPADDVCIFLFFFPPSVQTRLGGFRGVHSTASTYGYEMSFSHGNWELGVRESPISVCLSVCLHGDYWLASWGVLF